MVRHRVGLTGSGFDGQMQGSQRQTYSHSSGKQQQAACFLCTALSRLNLTPSCSRLCPIINILAANMGDDELPNVVYFDCLAVFVVVVSGYISREKARVLLHPGVGDTARRGEDCREHE